MSRKTAPWFKCFPEDWLEDTRLLTLAQRGAYFDVLCLMYGSDGRLTDNDSLIAHKLHVHIKTWRAIRKVLVGAGLLTSEGKHLTNKRAMKIVKERYEKRETLSKNSNARWNKTPRAQTSTSKTNTSAMQLHSAPDAIGVQLQTDREKERKIDTKQASPSTVTAQDELAGGNEVVDGMIKDLKGWMPSLGERGSREWLNSQRQIFGQAAFVGAYGKLKTKIAAGEMVSKPLHAWTEIARSMQAAASAPPTLSARERELERARKARALLNLPSKQVHHPDNPGTMHRDE